MEVVQPGLQVGSHGEMSRHFSGLPSAQNVALNPLSTNPPAAAVAEDCSEGKQDRQPQPCFSPAHARLLPETATCLLPLFIEVSS